ncbi:MAG TPA: CHASE domain-containing protein [Longimicrobium sp.]|nr:CHASE domain-containing protein [Longimicrobium sp.]
MPAPPQRPPPSLPPPRRRAAGAYLVLAAALLLTAAATLQVAQAARARDRARFENAVQSTFDRIGGRLETYAAMVEGAGGLFDASGDVTRAEFRAYVERLDVRRRYPGIQGIGFARRTAPGEAAAVEAEARAAGLAGFRVTPAGEAPERFPIVFLEPLDARNRAAVGFDMFSEPVRRAAMERARDAGQPVRTGRVVLRQEIGPEVQGGFLYYVPVYREAGLPPAGEARRARLEGFVYAPFRAGDLLRGVFGTERAPRVDFQLYDGSRADPAALLYDTRPRGEAGRRAAFSDTLRLPWAGRHFTLAFESSRAFESGMGRLFVAATALAGLLLSGVLFGLARAQGSARAGAEARAEALRAALAERERLVSIVESSTDFIGFATPEGDVAYLNAAGRRLVGLGSLEETRGKRMRDFHLPEDAACLEAEIVPAVLARGRWEGPFRMRHFVTGAPVPIHLNLFTIPDPETGEPIGLGTVTRDTTAELRARAEIETARRVAEEAAASSRTLAARLKTQALELERQVEQGRALNDELQRANRAKSQFLATMSHELRTPLNAVIGYADLLLAGIPEAIPEASQRQVERIGLASRHLLSVIEEILSHARIEAGRETVTAEEVDLGEVLREVSAIAEPLARDKRLVFRAPRRVEPATLVTDARKLRQILVNLLGNAVKFTASGEISFEVEPVGEWAEFRVRDTGIGIDPAHFDRIFEPFRQVDEASTRMAGGTGLGLSVSRHLARMLGGDVFVRSAPEEGSTFTLRLPLAPPFSVEQPVAPGRAARA